VDNDRPLSFELTAATLKGRCVVAPGGS
jgi:hypothetical protein